MRPPPQARLPPSKLAKPKWLPSTKPTLVPMQHQTPQPPSPRRLTLKPPLRVSHMTRCPKRGAPTRKSPWPRRHRSSQRSTGLPPSELRPMKASPGRQGSLKRRSPKSPNCSGRWVRHSRTSGGLGQLPGTWTISAASSLRPAGTSDAQTALTTTLMAGRTQPAVLIQARQAAQKGPAPHSVRCNLGGRRSSGADFVCQ